MKRKELLYIYISEFQGFVNTGFNFSANENFYVRLQGAGEIVLKKEEHNNKLPKDFWNQNISNVNLLIGDNGSGKTTIMRIICRWVCFFSLGRFPKEKGIMVVKESDGIQEYIRYIAFENKSELSILVEENSCLIKKMSNSEELILFFRDLKIIYFSNTMTELNLCNFDILSNYSMPQRIIDSNLTGFCNENIIANYKQFEFIKQVDSVLDEEIDIVASYIQMTIRDQTFEDILKPLSKEYVYVVKEISRLWQDYLIIFYMECSFEGQEIIVKILQAFFGGILDRLIWGKKVEKDNENKYVLAILADIVRTEKIIGENNRISDWAKWIKQILRDLLLALRSKNYLGDKDLKNAVINIDNFIDALLLNEKEDIAFLLRSYFINEKEVVCQINLKRNKEKFKKFWFKYKKVSSYMDNFHFSWNLSSGEQNRLNLLSIFEEISQKDNNIWLLLDEPDNTFHPEWSRKLIKKIIKVCNKKAEKNFQLWISTHSPILLSDMPQSSVTYLRTKQDENKKIKENVQLNTFGQNIYVLFNDAFFLQDGIIGEFACQKIVEIAIFLERLEELLDRLKREQNIKTQERNELNQHFEKFKKYEMLTDLVAEPLFRSQLKGYINNCKKLTKGLRQND